MTASDKRPAWSAFREALEQAGFRPSKRLGQNFLLDENMIRAIVRDARIERGDRVLEVGPGCGFLTLHLVHAGAELTCVEVDARLLEIARRLIPQSAGVRWILGDVLAGKHALNPEVAHLDPPWHLVSNLPYSVAAPLLACLAELDEPPRSMTVLVQREVAERIVAPPGTADWGPLSIRLQSHFVPKLGRSVPPSLFWPRPAVESSVVRLELREDRVPPGERAALDRLVADLFQHRRQGLARVLARSFGDRDRAIAALEGLGLDARERAENLDLPTLRALAALALPGPP